MVRYYFVRGTPRDPPIMLIESPDVANLVQQFSPLPYWQAGSLYFHKKSLHPKNWLVRLLQENLLGEKAEERVAKIQVRGVIAGPSRIFLSWKKGEPPPHLEIVQALPEVAREIHRFRMLRQLEFQEAERAHLLMGSFLRKTSLILNTRKFSTCAERTHIKFC
ncbi:MAG: hypothetical protein A2748_01105 [Candidatus Wildermuthbacteria bacterium RIFCSPHIGHO2_01_FULL_45_20]|uniref:Uncharacterized protein n=1 Tax=Candidatus Wildermuthbacteria bacterium RIFCSPHIGHO2_02_FULL_45_25 TaxID=1802450 RepID=A0A1G2R268_9BACT|nr:MAG: hypothetical protein A2748_01105 [Candidatus Wildermuthbacteria bacterium RIFCSPHIGHO2_01_FULL_45_20]OHA66807.1 MAG: hypothetical protein A3C04_02785 [Candidatus Wildermuthbacteria bacterium RIFCSPHIGHO2_02_FULL_45_25]